MCGVFRTSILCVFLSVSFDDFVLYCLILLLSCFFQYQAKRLAGKNVSKMTYFVLSGT